MEKEQNISNRLVFLLILIAAACLFLANTIPYFDYTTDDSFITFRYSQNWAAGLGPVFNPEQRVEGYSNFLWMALLALCGKLGFSIPVSSKILGIAFSIGAIVAAAAFARKVGAPAAVAASVGLLLSVGNSFLFYATSGMETVFFAFLVTLAAVLSVTERKTLAAIIFCAVAMTRPEGALPFLAGLAALFVLANATGKGGKRALLPVLPAILIFALFLLWRYQYYGSLVSNTFFAKPSTWPSGAKPFPWGFFDYAWGFFADGGLILLLPFAAVPLLKYRDYPAAIVGWILIGCGLIFAAYTNFDWMLYHRFLLPYLPLLCALGLTGLWIAIKRIRISPLHAKIVYALVLASFVAFNWAATQKERNTFAENKNNMPYSLMQSEQLIQIGRWMKENLPPETLLATKRIGAIPYISGFNTIDTYGLTDKRIARTIWDCRNDSDHSRRETTIIRDVLSRGADVLAIYGFESAKNENSFTKNNEIAVRMALDAEYTQLGKFRLGGTETLYLFKRPGYSIKSK